MHVVTFTVMVFFTTLAATLAALAALALAAPAALALAAPAALAAIAALVDVDDVATTAVHLLLIPDVPLGLRALL